ncbi:hypothetical protein G9A89_021199 [Geosiphon pyriformis]|nr:hypothetical protein G9A89_021199 [Geosiphon pyriformis]
MSNSWKRELVIPLISPAVQIIGDNLKINSVIGGSTTSGKREFATNRHLQHSRKETKNLCNNKFKVATTPDTTTLKYYQSIYTHCKQRFNIPDRIEVVKKSVYQYIENCINNYFFGNYNISEVRSNLYNNLVHYSRLGTEDLNSETLAIYFQELNFNIIEYCEEKYPVQSQYSIDFESKTKTSNKDKQRLKQYLRTTLNTPTLQKTTAKHLQTSEKRTSVKLPLSITLFLISLVQPQTPNSSLNHFSRPEDFQSPRNPIQQQEPISTSANIINYLQKNESNHSESLKSEKTESEPEEITENKKEMATAYIAKIPKFTGEDNNTIQKAGDANGWIAARMLKAIPYFLQGTAGKWFENFEKLFKNWQAFKDAFLQQFTNNNTSITLRNCFHNIKQETSETILDQFIAELKDKLIKKVCPHAPTDLATAIRHAKNYEMAMEEANHTKLTNSQRKLKAILQINNNSSNNHKDINHHNNTTKTILDHSPTTNLKIVIIVEFQDTENKIAENCKETNKTEVINIIFHHNNLTTNLHHQLIIYQDHKIKTQEDWFNITNLHPKINFRITTTESIPITSWFPEILVSKDPTTTILNSVILQCLKNRIFNNLHFLKVKLPYQNQTLPTTPFHQLKLPKMPISNESPFLLSNAAVNKQKAITAMYTETTVEGKPICLILDSGSARSIITYQLMQQLKRNIDRPAQTVIVTADGIKKTLVRKIDDFPFTIDGITIPVKVFANANLNWKIQELKISYQGQYTIISATCGTFNKQSEKALVFEFKEEKEIPLTETYMVFELLSNWAEKTKQEIFEELREWKKVRYSIPEPQKEPPYIPLKCKDCNKKLSSMGACISPEEEYETCTYYFCKACHREQFGSPKRSKKWDNTPCLTLCDQTCQYALSISEKVRRETLFDAAYNSVLNKLYHYSHNAEIIFDLAMALINGATQENVHQIKEAEYIKYTMELTGFDYEDEVETYHQIASHTYPTKEAQIQRLEQMNIQLCEECVMSCDDQWCLECYALSIPLPNENDENEIEFGVSELVKKLPTTPIYLLEKQPPLQLKYFNNHDQRIKPEKAHEIDAVYDLRYSGKDTLVLQPKSLTKINLKIALEIPPEAMIQIASRSLLASKGINIRGGVIDAGYTGDITIMLQNKTDKLFKIKHAEKIAQAIYLPLINISGLQSVNNREQLGKSKRGTQDFGSTKRFTVLVNIALNTQNESHQIL